MIVEALGDLGHAQPRLAAMLLQGSVDAAVRRIELGVAEEPGVIADTAVAMVLRGVSG
ncbi:TetR family transcriptional regulator [Streptomyces badius]